MPLPRSPSTAYRRGAAKWQWETRAAAYDKHLAAQRREAYEGPWRDLAMGEVERVGRMSEFGRNSLSAFYKESYRWTRKPLPTEEVVSEREVRVKQGRQITSVTEYQVRKVVLNVDALLNPDLAFRVKKFSDTHRGMSIELYDAAEAIDRVHEYDQTNEAELSTTAVEITIPAGLIAPSFLAPFLDLSAQRHTEYVFYGGRGSTKSSFVSLVIIWQLINNQNYHALVIRQVFNTLRDSAYGQLVWAINALGNYYPQLDLQTKFRCTTNPLEITYLPTGQKIYFRGADDPGKIKSIKPAFGAISLLWFEETSEFYGAAAIRNITQSAIRGTDTALIFKTYNPPRTSGNWINKEVLISKPNRYLHKSDYRTVPAEWLGQVFIDEAEHIREVNPAAYDHEYLGEVNGLGDQVFTNVQLREIADDEISQFDNVLHGLDFGFYPHPAHYSRVHYDAARLTLYIFGELRRWKTSNRDMYDALVAYGLSQNDLLICDSEDPKSIADYRDYGAMARGAEKGAGSRKYSIKWLQSLKAIVIDPKRCPYTATEFTDYAYLRTKDDEILEAYPDENDDAISAVRYATNLIWRRRGQ